MNEAMQLEYRRQIEHALAEMIKGDDIEVPPYPTQAMRLWQLAKADEYRMEDLVKVVKGDQALCAQVMRFANSPAAARSREVASVEAAIAFMGVQQLLSVACSVGLKGHVVKAGPLSQLRRAIWMRSVLRAETAARLAKFRGHPDDVAFLCGLLCDFGKVVTVQAIEHYLDKQPEAAEMPPKFWMDIIRAYESQVGLILSTRWSFPSVLQAVMSELASYQRENPLVDVILTSDQVVGVMRANTCVTMESLESAQGLASPEERAFALRCVPALTEVAAELCATKDSPRKVEPGLVEGPTLDGARWESHQTEFPVDVVRGKERMRYTACAVALDGFTMAGKKPLQTQELTRLALQTPNGDIEIFGTVVNCTMIKRNSHELVVRLFATSKENKAIWDEVVKDARLAWEDVDMDDDEADAAA